LIVARFAIGDTFLGAHIEANVHENALVNVRSITQEHREVKR
jgi:hypothetical protein